MTSLWIVVGMAMACVELATAGTQPIDLYSKRYNNLDIDTILSSDRLVRNYVDCLLSRKPCSPEGKEFKRLLPEALRTKCGKCSNNQKEAALHILKKLYTVYPDYYNDLRAKWDPSGEYHRKYEEYLREEQFNIINDNPSQQDIYSSSNNEPSERPFGAAYPSQPNQLFTPTQRPARNPEGEQNFGVNRPVEEPTFSINNRFAEDEIETGPAGAASAVSTTNENAPPASSGATYLPPQVDTVSSTTLLSIVVGGTTEGSVVPSSTTGMPGKNVGGGSLVASGSGTMMSKLTTSAVSPTTTRSPVTVPSASHVPTRQPSFIEQLFPAPPSNLAPIGSGPFGLGIIERLGTKLTNTAEFFAEMVRNTVKQPKSKSKYRVKKTKKV